MVTARMAGPYNGMLPSATGTVITYARNPKDFKINRYAQWIESPGLLGLYFKTVRDDMIRVIDPAQFVWADGDDRPVGDWNQVRFEAVEFSIERLNYPFRVGNWAMESAKDTWDPLAHESMLTTQQAMIVRTLKAITILEADANWDGNVDSANALNGGAGKWDTASDQPADPHYNAIKKSLLKAAERVNLATNSVVQPDDLVLLVSPGAAQAMANTAEVSHFMAYGPYSKEVLEGPTNYNFRWGLPPTLYGFDIVVEDASRVSGLPTANASASASRAYIKSDVSAILLSRKGGINGAYGVKAFSTFQMYWHDFELAVEVFDQPEHKRVQGNVVDAYKSVLAAPHSGYKIDQII
jgi:hypothetical protein